MGRRQHVRACERGREDCHRRAQVEPAHRAGADCGGCRRACSEDGGVAGAHPPERREGCRGPVSIPPEADEQRLGVPPFRPAPHTWRPSWPHCRGGCQETPWQEPEGFDAEGCGRSHHREDSHERQGLRRRSRGQVPCVKVRTAGGETAGLLAG